MLLAGEIGKPHGIAGQVYVVPISDDPRRFEAGARLVHADGRTLVVEDFRRHKGDRFLAKFEGIDTRTDAEGLRGSLFVSESEPRDLQEGEYMHSDLIGCTVVAVNGEILGTVAGVMSGVAQDLLEVETASGGGLIPLVKEMVKEIDVPGARITVTLPEGLLD